MGNVAVAIKGRGVRGSSRWILADITGSSSYATNGDTIVAADITKILGVEGNFALTDVLSFQSEIGNAGHSLRLDRTNKKIKFFNGTTEIANAVDVSTVVCRCEFVVDVPASQ